MLFLYFLPPVTSVNGEYIDTISSKRIAVSLSTYLTLKISGGGSSIEILFCFINFLTGTGLTSPVY